ncbi:hypothetical protein C5Y96_05720 [Blastopirellula marina]|uniref:Phage portal protein n=1 Tax=Blastopirellula marina TaxID=124 RepID=A0A2S8G4H2_9BACT|nr:MULTISPECIES: phage portal protein [Pirellulaceae]PQO39352.1 hypothetical protein C5Y96_05720 [Blastopirellula marina]RCS55660.1 phage portal protein [Bremerella cremea]
MSKQPTPGGLFSSAKNAILRKFGFNAAESSTKRKSAPGGTRDEDDELTPAARTRLVANGRDALQNWSIAGFMVRKHLDFVTGHTFQAKTPDKGFNRALEEWVEEVSKAEHFDQSEEHDREQYTRMAEARRIVDGDIGNLKLSSGHIQAIENDRIKDPGRGAPVPYDQVPEWRHGVRKVNNKAVAYAIHRRTGNGGLTFERIVPANRMYLYAYRDGTMRFDSSRGVSALAPALNDLRDVAENQGHALAKMKVAQLFGLKMTRNGEGSPAPTTSTDATDRQGNTKRKHKIDFGNGPVFLDLNPGEDAEFLENKTPSMEFQAFMQATISVALKCIDIPFSFYDEAYTNFFGSRAALLLYLKSCNQKRRSVQAWNSHWFEWRFAMGHARREIIPPRSLVDGFKYAWVPDGLPWWRPSEEIAADIRAIGAGVKTRGDVTMAHFGRTFEDTAELLEAEENIIRGKQINIYESPALDTAAAGQVASSTGFGSLNPATIEALAAAVVNRLEMEKR